MQVDTRQLVWKEGGGWLQKPTLVKSYEVRVRFGTRVRVRDSAIFEKDGCRCEGTRRLKNY